MGTVEITLLEVLDIQIHGSLYHQITYRPSAGGQAQAIRINPEAFYAHPKAGDRVEVELVMGNIMGARKVGEVQPENTPT
jgi:hypothetical protein